MGSDFRIPYGFARGPMNNFFVRTDNLFTSGDATPDVTLGNLWYTNNTSALVITDFDLSDVASGGSVAPKYEGKEITIFFTDNNTTIANNSRVILSTSAQTFAASQNLSLLYHNSAWIETARSRNNTTGDVQTFTATGTASYTVTDVKLAILVTTAASTSVRSLSGGTVGQTIALFANVTNGITIQIDTGGNLYIPGTSTIVMNASGAYTFTKVDASRWVMERPVA